MTEEEKILFLMVSTAGWYKFEEWIDEKIERSKDITRIKTDKGDDGVLRDFWQSKARVDVYKNIKRQANDWRNLNKENENAKK